MKNNLKKQLKVSILILCYSVYCIFIIIIAVNNLCDCTSPQLTLELLLKTFHFNYDLILKSEDLNTTNFQALLTLTIIYSKAKFWTSLDFVRRYSNFVQLQDTAGYFLEQLQAALEFLNSPLFAMLEDSTKVKTSHDEYIRSSPRISMKLPELNMSDSESSCEEFFGLSLTASTGFESEENSNKPIYCYPRAIVTKSHFPQNSLELAVSQGVMIDIIAGDPCVNNPLGLFRSGWLIGDYAGCRGWIPKEYIFIILLIL